MPTRTPLNPFGPFEEVDRDEAYAMADDAHARRHLLTITSDQVFRPEANDPVGVWIAYSGIRLVNAYLFFRARRRLPARLRAVNVTLENGQPKLAGEDGWSRE